MLMVAIMTATSKYHYEIRVSVVAYFFSVACVRSSGEMKGQALQMQMVECAQRATKIKRHGTRHEGRELRHSLY